jgi:hypothetical protein
MAATKTACRCRATRRQAGRVTPLWGKGPTAAVFAVRVAFIGNEHLPAAKPQQQPLDVRIGFAQAEQVVAHLPGAAEHIGAAGGHFVQDETPIQSPAQAGGHLGQPRTNRLDPHAEGPIGAAGGEKGGKPDGECGRFLEVGDDDGADGRERANVPAELDDSGAPARGGHLGCQNGSAAIRTAVDGKNDLAIRRVRRRRISSRHRRSRSSTSAPRS